MKTGRLSDNVEIDCLGKRTKITSPEASAAFACQTEVNSFREKVVSGSLRTALQQGMLSMTDSPEKTQALEGALDKQFDQTIGDYADSKASVVGRIFDSLSGKKDNYDTRILEFENLFK
jgi:hypothetical protein